jgi:tRNA G46 methylase TrmB
VVHLNREFQSYAVDNGVYFGPVDDVSRSSVSLEADLTRFSAVEMQDEIERLQYLHSVFNMVFENRLIFPPIPRPRRILECGSGSGDWAAEVAEQYPECEVGILSQPLVSRLLAKHFKLESLGCHVPAP